MISGRFGDTSGRPYVEARVLFPRLKMMIAVPPPGEADVSFLMDTGADLTTIMPTDWLRFSLGYERLVKPFTIYGVGGKAEGFIEEAIITFVEPGSALRVYAAKVIILRATQYIMEAPSLLGRDIMNKWSVTFDRPGNRIAVRVAKADHTFKLTKQLPGLIPLPGVAPAIIHS